MLYADDLIGFFGRCCASLVPGGMLFVKENNAKSGRIFDEDDSSVTRYSRKNERRESNK